MRRRVRLTGAAVALVGVTGAGVATGVATTVSGQGDTAATLVGGKPTSTSPVTRGDLVVTETLDGTLGYADSTTVTGRLGGTVTALAGAGSVIRRGKPLFAVDDEPVLLLYGKLPAYRTMTVGTEGRDVRQLERNLRALGYGDGLEVDETYTSYTAEQVREWQQDNGLEETGEVPLGSVVFAPGPVRIAEHEVAVGSSTGPGQPVLMVTGLRRVVTVDLPVSSRSLARVSARTKVTLPGGRTVTGGVAWVGTTATTDGEEQGGGAREPTVEVRVTLGRLGSFSALDSAPVEVTFQSEHRKDVLSVPVTALVALTEGRYGVVVVDGDARRTVAVELGVFTEGRVEVAGEGLRAGMRVEVPTS